MVEHTTLSLMVESLPSFNLQLFRGKPALVELFPRDVPSRPRKKGLIFYISNTSTRLSTGYWYTGESHRTISRGGWPEIPK